jgi:hypothetical protein
LGQALNILAKTNPQLGATIQQKVVQSKLWQLIVAHIAATNGTVTAATDVDGGGANARGNSGGGFGGARNGFSGNSAPGAVGFANPATTGGGTTVIMTFSPSPT